MECFEDFWIFSQLVSAASSKTTAVGLLLCWVVSSKKYNIEKCTVIFRFHPAPRSKTPHGTAHSIGVHVSRDSAQACSSSSQPAVCQFGKGDFSTYETDKNRPIEVGVHEYGHS